MIGLTLTSLLCDFRPCATIKPANIRLSCIHIPHVWGMNDAAAMVFYDFRGVRVNKFSLTFKNENQITPKKPVFRTRKPQITAFSGVYRRSSFFVFHAIRHANFRIGIQFSLLTGHLFYAKIGLQAQSAYTGGVSTITNRKQEESSRDERLHFPVFLLALKGGEKSKNV